MNNLNSPFAASPDKLSTGTPDPNSQLGTPDQNRLPAAKVNEPKLDRAEINSFFDSISKDPTDMSESTQSDVSRLAQGLPVDQVDRNGPEFTDFKLRATGAVARTLKEEVGFWQGVFNKKPGDDNVRVDEDGTVYYRRGANDKFAPLDDKSKITLGDVADMIPGIVEAVGQTGFELAGSTIGATVGSVAGPPGMIAGAVIGGITGSLAGAASAVGVRKSAAESLGIPIDESETFAKQFIPQVGTTVAFGAIPLAIQAGGSGFRALKNLLKIDKLEDIKTLGFIKRSAQEEVENLGYAGRNAADISSQIAAEGGLLDQKLNKFGEIIGIYKDTALKNNRYSPVPLEKTLTAMDDILTSQGAKIDPSTGKMVMPDSPITIDGVLIAPEAKTAFRAGGFFGDQNGKRYLQGLVDDFNSLVDAQRSSGGINFNRLDQIIDKYQQLSKFDEKFNQSIDVINTFRNLQHAAGKDRNGYIVKGLKGTADESIVQKAFDDYSEVYSVVSPLRSKFDQVGTAEAFADALVRPNNAKEILALKTALGPDSSAFKEFASAALDKKIIKHTDLVDGFLDARKFYDDLASLGPETLDAIGFDKTMMNKFKAAAIQFQRISMEELRTGPIKFDGALNLIRMVFGNQLSRNNARLNAVYNLTKSNSNLADYMANEGFLKMAKESVSEAEKKQFVEMSFKFKDMLKNSAKVKRKIKGKNGPDSYYYIPVSAPLIREGLATSVSESGDAIPRAVEEMVFNRKMPNKSFKDIQRNNPELVLDFKEGMEVNSAKN